MKNITNKIKKYKELKADIVDIELRIQELEEEMLGATGIGYEERTGKTYKITSSTEQQAEIYLEKKDRLLKLKESKEREITRIDNAMSILKEEERDIIQTALIEQKKYSLLEIKYNRCYSRLKQIEYEAIKKMQKYLA